MSWPKSIKTLREKYPEASRVVQFRIGTDTGDSLTFEGILPSFVTDLMIERAFNFSLGEVAEEQRAALSSGSATEKK